MRRSAGLAASLFLTALGLAGCGHGGVIGSGPLPTSPPITPSVTNEFSVPTAGSKPNGIALGRDGFLYFTELNPSAGNIGQSSNGGTIKEINIAAKGGTAGNFGVFIASGPDGNLWFTEQGAAPGIAKMDLGGSAVTEYPIPGSAPQFITTGPVINTLVFTDPGHNAVGQITTSGTVTEAPLPTANANPLGITLLGGNVNNAYFTEHDASKIGIYNAVANTVTEVPTLTANAGPTMIVQGPDGALWFTENNAAQLGRLSTSGTITEYPLAPAKSATALVVGLDNNFYFADPVQNKFGQFNPLTLKVTEFNIPAQNATPGNMTIGSDSLIYMTEQGANKIGQINY
jgi:virginiamycin B lyase